MSAETKANKHLIIHTDPGSDDAVAVINAVSAASGKFAEVSAIATYGNRSTRDTGRNLLTIGAIIDDLRRTDVILPQLIYASGSEHALDKNEPFTDNADFIQGENGMGGLRREPTRQQLVHAEVVYDRFGSHPQAKAEILSLAAPTDLARTVTHPNMKGKIESITVMGGTLFEEGNYSMHAEWNLANDPKAMEIVLRECETQKIPFTLVPLDLTQIPDLHFTSKRATWLDMELRSRGSIAIADTIKKLVGTDSTYYQFFTSRTKTTGNRKPPYDRVRFSGAAIHDLTAQLVHADPDNFEIYPMQVLVDDKGQIGTAREYMENDDFQLHKVNVAMGVKSADRYWDKIVEQFSCYQ